MFVLAVLATVAAYVVPDVTLFTCFLKLTAVAVGVEPPPCLTYTF